MQRTISVVITRPGVARDVLQKHWSLAYWLSHSSFVKISSMYCKAQTVRARELKFLRECSPSLTCHMSCVTFPMSHVMRHMSHVTLKKLQSDEACWWRVCYQPALPRLVNEQPLILRLFLWLPEFESTECFPVWRQVELSARCCWRQV